MQRNLIRAFFVGTAFMLCMGQRAQAQPTPAPTATPPPVTYSGYLRSFYFTRQNASGYTKPFTAFNQAAFNTAVSIHAAYAFAPNWSIGGTYLYADPLNNCADPKSHVDTLSPCYRSRTFDNATGGTNPDDTLPDFRLSTLYEAYVQYKDPTLYLKLGDQVINTPWANASDSRLKPVAFQGGDVSYNFSSKWTGELMYMARFEDRASSDFTNTTLLTETTLPSANYGGAEPDVIATPFTAITNSGFGYARLGYASGAFVANLHYYMFADIANAFWGDAKYTWKSYAKPFIALQGGSETNTGSAIIGKINSQILGIQGGISPWNNVDLTIGYDYIPQKSDTITLPTGTTCGSNNQIKGLLPYFLPGGGTTNCFNNPNGTTNVYYGGWASPYTDSYATDILFNTMISQGMVDRRSPGQGVKISGTFYTFEKRVRLIVAHAWWDYGNGTSGVSPTQETDIDGTYYFNKVGKGAYHGFSLRHRYAERVQAFTSAFGGAPLFKYNRTQLEYDF
jgi:hypothetical protein